MQLTPNDRLQARQIKHSAAVTVDGPVSFTFQVYFLLNTSIFEEKYEKCKLQLAILSFLQLQLAYFKLF